MKKTTRTATHALFTRCIIALSVTLLLLSSYIGAYAGVPKGINYQAVVRTAAGVTAANQSIGAQFTIHSGSPSGAIVFREHHTVPTNAFGVFTVVIGGGNITTGDLDSINWSTGDYYLQVETDPSGANNYIDMGTTQLLSVPMSLYSNKALKADTAAYTQHAITADYATNAQHATTADTATIATTAAHAINADHALTADNATHAQHASTADTATIATHAITADHALLADNATNAQHAATADTAVYSTNAAHAAAADHALLADYADLARHATKSDTAGFTQHALIADSVVATPNTLHADTASFTGYAVRSDSATVAVKSLLADSSTNAKYADTSATALSAAQMRLSNNNTVPVITGPYTLTINPQSSLIELQCSVGPSSAALSLTNGFYKGQMIVLNGGSSMGSSNGVRLTSGGNLNIGSGNVDIKGGDMLVLMWVDTKWIRVAFTSNN
jgi:hypothetical protein